MTNGDETDNDDLGVDAIDIARWKAHKEDRPKLTPQQIKDYAPKFRLPEPESSDRDQQDRKRAMPVPSLLWNELIKPVNISLCGKKQKVTRYQAILKQLQIAANKGHPGALKLWLHVTQRANKARGDLYGYVDTEKKQFKGWTPQAEYFYRWHLSREWEEWKPDIDIGPPNPFAKNPTPLNPSDIPESAVGMSTASQVQSTMTQF